MKKKKSVSLKTQFALSFIPYIGLLIVWLFGAYDLTRERGKKYSHMICYMLSLFVPAIVLMLPLGLILANLESVAARTVVASVGGYLVCLLTALCGVWAQKRILKKTETEENNAYIA